MKYYFMTFDFFSEQLTSVKSKDNHSCCYYILAAASLTLTGLSPEGVYELYFQVRAVCTRFFRSLGEGIMIVKYTNCVHRHEYIISLYLQVTMS